VLGLFGADDALIPQSDVEELRRRAASGRADRGRRYPGAGTHSRTSCARRRFAPAVDDGWRRALEFFAKHLTRARVTSGDAEPATRRRSPNSPVGAGVDDLALSDLHDAEEIEVLTEDA
jgi:hypothetical protein